jgi:hypothetical protein
MTSTDLVIPERASLRLPIGLAVSTGAPKPERGPGRPINHFRFKEGDLEQYAEAAAKAMEVYGPEPKELDDVLLFSNDVHDILDIRVKAWGSSGARIIGKTNFAAIPDKDAYLHAIEAWDDEILFYPLDAAEVEKARGKDAAEAWRGEPLESKLTGPDDPRIKRYEMSVEATFRFGLPRVLGLGKVVLYGSKSARNRDNLRDALWFSHEAFRGQMIGIHFRLAVRPRRTRYFDEKKKARITGSGYEVVLDTPWTLAEAMQAMVEMRESLGSGPTLELTTGDGFFADDERRLQIEEEARIIAASRELPQPTDEDVRTREEPSAIQRLDDAQLNRLANLAGMFDGDLSIYLRGAFAVDALDELTPDQAVQAELALERLTGEERVEEGEYEEVDLNGIDF